MTDDIEDGIEWPEESEVEPTVPAASGSGEAVEELDEFNEDDFDIDFDDDFEEEEDDFNYGEDSYDEESEETGEGNESIGIG